MESTIDLILKGHFERLREKVTSENVTSHSDLNLVTTLKETIDYLHGDNSERAKEIRSKLSDLRQAFESEQSLTVKKKPMKKAGGKREQKQERKAI